MSITVLLGLLLICVAVISAAVILWRRGALTIDSTKARDSIDDLLNDTKCDAKHWSEWLRGRK